MDITLLCSATTDAVDADENENGLPKRFSGIAYSGGAIPDYGSFGQVAIDLSTLKVPTKRLFALVNHDPNQRAGTFTLSNAGDVLQVDGEFMDTESGNAVASEFKQGAPWEFSVRVQGKKQLVDRTRPVRLNGREMTIDLMISDASIREVSFVPAGADPNTTAIAFSMEDSMNESVETTAVVTQEQKVESTPSLDFQLTAMKAERDLLFSTVAQVQEERDSAQEQLSAMIAERDALKAELKAIALIKRDAQVRALFSIMNREMTDEASAPYLALDDQTFALLQQDIQATFALAKSEPNAPDLDASLTVEQATSGMPTPTNPLDRAIVELRLAHPTMTQEQAMARALEANPSLYVSVV